MSKRFCHFQTPNCILADGTFSTDEEYRNEIWHPETAMSYRADSRWGALCASVKEEIIEMLFDRNRSNVSERANALQTKANDQWQALPAAFRFEGSLKQSNHTPFERDFLIAIRLDFLQISFLLECLQLDRLAEPSLSVIEVAQHMLHLVVEAILLRDQIVNAGTGLDWKVSNCLVPGALAHQSQISYYGLPSAGILLLALLRQQREPNCPQVPRARVLADLTVLAAEVERGTIVRQEDPNYALLSQATRTIQRFLDCVLLDGATEVTVQEQQPSQYDDQWLAQWEHDPRDFDIDFWQGLGDHAFLFGLNPTSAT